jgi:hypothetical protein
MARKHRIGFSASAVAELDDVRGWYSHQQVPGVGERLSREVVSQVERLDVPDETAC